MLFLGLNSKAALIAYFIPAYTIFQAHACNFSYSRFGMSGAVVIFNYESFVVLAKMVRLNQTGRRRSPPIQRQQDAMSPKEDGVLA